MKTITLAELRRMIELGTIDTVLAVFPDQQGRLTGKRLACSLPLRNSAS